ncbi:MAG TPA: hypothetical protein VMV27_11115 [Candidatus Binataceae bacterium]|nr:hypothetical protein [Candidatus Binataceae bacterium]
MAKMFRFTPFLVLVALGLAPAGGCGLFYQAGTRVKASRMTEHLKVGEPMSEIHQKYGEPDIHQFLANNVEIWSYPYKPNSNDLTAALLYTSTKEGDTGTFVDLKFLDGKLVSWAEAEHTMAPKERGGFSTGMGAPKLAPPGGNHY